MAGVSDSSPAVFVSLPFDPLRILKGCVSASAIIRRMGFIAIRSVEDTERLNKLFALQCYSCVSLPFDPLRILKASVAAVFAHVAYRFIAIRSVEDTESSYTYAGLHKLLVGFIAIRSVEDTESITWAVDDFSCVYVSLPFDPLRILKGCIAADCILVILVSLPFDPLRILKGVSGKRVYSWQSCFIAIRSVEDTESSVWRCSERVLRFGFIAIRSVEDTESL